MDPLSIPAGRWIETRKPRPRHRLQYWTPANNVRGNKGQIFTDDRDQYGRDLGFSDVLAPRRVGNRGWFADQWQDDVIRTSQGTLYVPVTGCTGWDGAVHYMADAERVPRGSDEAAHDEAIRDAAARADRLAELEAEEAREYAAKDQAERDKQTARETIHALNRETLGLIKAIKASGRTFEAPVCSALMHRVRDLLADRAEQFKAIKERTGDYWTAVVNF